MRFFGAITLVLPLCAAAQTAVPTINPLGIVRGDTARPGLLAPGIAFGIWGHGYGPKAGCKGPATEVCGVQVLLDGAPIELDYTNDVQINARMPDGVGAAVSKLVVVSGGLRSEPTEVRRLPEVAVISLDGVARVDGPVWIHVELPGRQGVSYPPLSFPWDFACESFEVRKDGKLLAPLRLPRLGMVYSGPSCPGAPNSPSRLPLHLQYDFAEPGIYEVRLSNYGDFGRRPNDIRSQSAWTKITVLPAGPTRVIGARPQGAEELLYDFLPNLLALRNDAALEVMLEYLYHANPRVRAYAANALYYWPDTVVEPRLLAMLKADGPSPVVIQRIKGHDSELAAAAIQYLFSDDPVLFEGAIRAAATVLAPASSITPELRLRVEQQVVSAVTGNLGHADAQTTIDLIAILGQIKTAQVHELLWNLVDRGTGIEQALIVIAWQKNPEDLRRLADYLIAAPAEDDSGRRLWGVPYAMRNNFGDAALPWLREVLEKARGEILRMRCAEELMRVNDPAAFAFALDAFGRNQSLKAQIRMMVNDQFPDTRNLSDANLAKFLSAHAK